MGMLSAALAAGGMFVASATAGPEEWTAARYWDEQMLAAIRLSLPRPPVHARNLYHVSAAMYDAWATYDPVARGVFFHEKHTAEDVDAARYEAITYAAYRVLKFRYTQAAGPNWPTIQANLDAAFAATGYDPGFTSTKGDSPAAIGNRIAEAVLDAAALDNSNEPNNFAPNNGYEPVNEHMVFKLPGCEMVDPNRWQPLAFDFLVLQGGIVVGAAIQAFICPHWAGVTPFGLRDDHRDPVTQLYFDPGPPAGVGTETFKDMCVELIEFSSKLDPSLDEMIDISPGARGNNSLGADDGAGHPVNPATGLPYEPQVVKLADFGRAVAEFWADGPTSETPPGHWHVVANDVSDTEAFEKRIGGVGPIVDDLEWDVKMYLAIAGAAHDAAIVAWGAKGYYDSSRPISNIRYAAGLGQSSDPKLPNYHPDGLPLIDGLIEQVTAEDILPGARFEEFPELIYEPLSGEPIGVNDHVGDLAVRSWTGGFVAGQLSSNPAASATKPGHVIRCDSTWTFSSYSVDETDTPGAPNPGCGPQASIVLNEIRLAQPGRDVDEYVEIAGPPGASLDGLTYVMLGDETQTGVPSPQGRVIRAVDLTGHVLDENGILLIAESTLTIPASPDIVTPLNLEDFENSTHYIVTGFFGYEGWDADFFDAGVLSFEPWTSIVDSVSIRASLNTDLGLYAPAEVGPDDSKNQIYGVDWMLADRWMPYQSTNFVTPPFAGYTSGHSTFSRATAEVMAAYTGDEYFPGGLSGYYFPAHKWLQFEDGPSTDLYLQWATYFDASDEAAQSRRWGGIHPYIDDYPARINGSMAGKCAFAKAMALYAGLANSPDIDCSGAVDGADLGTLLANWGPCSGSCGSDLDGSGEVDGADLGILLANWG